MDRLIPEARATTNFIGNTGAPRIVAPWAGECDATKAREILAGRQGAAAETETGWGLPTVS